MSEGEAHNEDLPDAEQSRRIVLSFFERVGSGAPGDVQRAVEEVCAEDVVWHVPRSMWNGGPHVGREKTLEMLNNPVGGTDMYETGTFDIEMRTVIADRGWVCIPMVFRATLSKNGEPYENDYNMIYRLEGDRIAEIWENFDSLAFQRAHYEDAGDVPG